MKVFRTIAATLALLSCLSLCRLAPAQQGPKPDVPLTTVRTLPGSVKRAALSGAKTVCCARATVEGKRYLLHYFTTDDKTAEEEHAYLDVFLVQGKATYTRLQRVTLTADFPRTNKLSLLYLEPKKKRGPMLVHQDYDLLAVLVFPEGLKGKAYEQWWVSPEAATYSYDYALGPVDKQGRRTIAVTYNEMGAPGPTVTNRSWKGTQFED
jgi:hypothetical protein